jgi:hypothetical protein
MHINMKQICQRYVFFVVIRLSQEPVLRFRSDTLLFIFFVYLRIGVGNTNSILSFKII